MIAYVSNDLYEEIDVAEIYIMDDGGLNKNKLTSGPYYNRYPVWSPDGSKIAYSSTQATGSSITQTWVMDADGSNRSVLASGLGSYDLAWSPDGSRVAISDGDIYTIDVDGSNKSQLTDDNGRDSNLGWSPDGSKIVFQRVTDKGLNLMDNTIYKREIYVIDADGSSETKLT